MVALKVDTELAEDVVCPGTAPGRTILNLDGSLENLRNHAKELKAHVSPQSTAAEHASNFAAGQLLLANVTQWVDNLSIFGGDHTELPGANIQKILQEAHQTIQHCHYPTAPLFLPSR